MANLSLEVKGLREFRRDTKRLDPEVDKEMRRDLREAGAKVLAEARSSAPMKTGALARSLKLGVTQKSISVYSDLPYAPVVHWGGRIMPRGVAIDFPRTEFISRAVERGADQLATDISESVERAARRVGWH